MKHTIKIIFGKEQVNKIHNSKPLTKEELNLNVKGYSFNSEIERIAFCKGIEEAVGWTECYICEENLV